MGKDGRKVGEVVEAGAQWRAAVVPTLALITIGIVPGLLKGIYEPYTGTLMAAYVTFGLSFIGLVIGGLAVMAVRDLSGRKMTIFTLQPSEQSDTEEGLAPVRSREDRTE